MFFRITTKQWLTPPWHAIRLLSFQRPLKFRFRLSIYVFDGDVAYADTHYPHTSQPQTPNPRNRLC